MIRASHTLSATLLAGLAMLCAPAHAQFGGGGASVPAVTLTLTDIVDVTPGADLWHLSFSVAAGLQNGSVLTIPFADSYWGAISNVTQPAAFAPGSAVTPGIPQTDLTFKNTGATTVGSSVFGMDAVRELYIASGTTLKLQNLTGTPGLRTVTWAAATPPAPVPEASTLSMLAAGLVAMGWLRRRQTQA